MSGNNLYKGSLTNILLQLLQENEKMYGYEITQEVKKLTKGKMKISEGALYPSLHKLEAEGILEVELQKVDNRLRKYYKLTEKGNQKSSVLLQELEDYLASLQ